MIDLHTHSCFSDGSETPEELVSLASQLGLRALALTDHDNLAGQERFLNACRKQKLTGIAGVELSVEVPVGTLHIVGLGVDAACLEFNEALQRVLESRECRNRRILTKLKSLGMELSWDDIAAYAGQDVIGRPHIARAIVDHGWAKSIQNAFERFLTKGAPAYVNRYRMNSTLALRLIREAHGIAILAHPYSWYEDISALEPQVEALKAEGLAGIEAYHTNHTPEMTIDYLRLAKRQGLLISGGSDYHGFNIRPDTQLGTGLGQLCVPDALLEPIIEAIGLSGHYHREVI